MKLGLIGLLIFLSAGGLAASQSKEDCFRWGVASETKQRIAAAFQEILSPENKDILPGLPEGDFKFRKIEKIGRVGNSALVFVAYRAESREAEAFYQVFDFSVDSGKVSPLAPMITDGDNGGRMWDMDVTLSRACDAPRLRLKFQIGTECCDGRRRSVFLKREDLAGNWTFSEVSRLPAND